MSGLRRKFQLAIAALALTLVVGGAAAELLLRYLCLVCTWMETNAGEYVSPYQEPFDNRWYHLRTPDAVYTYGQPEFDYELRMNSLGIRDVEHPIEKPAGEFRIVGLGDSFTEGQGAPYESTYLKVLERGLDEKLEVDVRVIVGGVAGSDPFYSYRLLRDKLLAFRPDLITLAVNNSDVMDVIARGGDERFLPDGTVRFNEPPADEWLFARSHLYRAFVTLLGYDWLGLSPSEHVARREEAVEELKGILGEYQSLARSAGCRFVVILHPDSFELSTEAYSFNVGALKQYFAENGISYVDLMEYFVKRTGPDRESREKLYWKKDFHHNAAGYRMFAEGVEEYLLGNGVLESLRPIGGP
jgi:lysophospholipase L1-like esterase